MKKLCGLVCLLGLVVLCYEVQGRHVAGEDGRAPHPRRRLVPRDRVRFHAELSEVSNPERGFFHEIDFFGQPLDFTAITAGKTLVRVMARLDAYRQGEVPTSFLAALEESLRRARIFGVKLILRFAYNDGPYPHPEADAPLPRVLRHIEQLAPILQTNKDVIAWLEAGFIGAWGEWHSSTYGLDSPENKLLIRDKLLLSFPSDRFVLFRYPGDIIAWYPRPLLHSEAFSSLPQARVGHHNDCFLASPDDEGTYTDLAGQNRIGEWQAYLAQMTRFVPMAGETCAPYPPRSNCATALAEMALLHWTALNEDWHPEVIAGFKRQGCYQEIRDRLGYRLRLLQGAWEQHTAPGQTLHLWLALVNEGFAAPLFPRKVYVVLISQNRRFLWPLELDPRRWEPGEHTITARVVLPQDWPAGSCALGLWLPDPADSLREDARYAIRFANEGVWDPQTGINFLGDVTVAGGH